LSGENYDFVTFTIPGCAVAFARAGKHGKQHYTPGKQAAAMGSIGWLGHQAMAHSPPFEGPLRMKVRAIYMPPKKRPKGYVGPLKWKVSRPDTDNLGKIVADSLNGICYRDDAQIVDFQIQKIYGIRAETVVTIEAISSGGDDP
jgi:Holliday junction resolvase RusA-like endonuclease